MTTTKEKLARDLFEWIQYAMKTSQSEWPIRHDNEEFYAQWDPENNQIVLNSLICLDLIFSDDDDDEHEEDKIRFDVQIMVTHHNPKH